ncbi:hypothetical protein EHS13_17170 [Paenibacillus psychroresistens]|uniref:DUF4830 domain-containing protein n=1 Tax=Paenibacillus psychroresistens TaxID=1778678 RepID=A0A6B8RLI2_9BACL|nr:hypothetical protein [Paenibacillus psychroresistens]QGQ96492.1 hypothetical protein EHS13_17170 [Paenibacillus psychroresistens]
MKRISLSLTIFGLVLLILSGCKEEVMGDQETAKQYVEKLGYKITSTNEQVYKYIIEKGTMEDTLNQQIWGVQQIEPDKYFGKDISMYGFTVSNHPLEKLYNLKTTVSIMLCDGKVIGGTSFPAGKGEQRLLGAAYTLDGKTLEEATGLTYKEWKEKWHKKYGNAST